MADKEKDTKKTAEEILLEVMWKAADDLGRYAKSANDSKKRYAVDLAKIINSKDPETIEKRGELHRSFLKEMATEAAYHLAENTLREAITSGYRRAKSKEWK